ncbi:MAG: SBBP repeat-containing protein [Candidatus Kariarchaeaceae archaeon]|jgi:hypothetical protein
MIIANQYSRSDINQVNKIDLHEYEINLLQLDQIKNQDDVISDVMIDNDGVIYTLGYYSEEATGPITTDPTTFLSKISISGDLEFNVSYPGTDFGQSFTFDNQGNIIIVGKLDEFGSEDDVEFSPPTNAINSTRNEEDSGFILIVNQNGEYINSSFWGGSDYDEIVCVEIDSEDNLIIAGITQSIDLPIVNAIDNENLYSNKEGFISKFTPNGNLVFSTYLGGSEDETVRDLKIDDEDSIVVVGSTSSPDFPGVQTQLTGTSDGFITKLDNTGQLLFSSLLGGSSSDSINTITIDEKNGIYASGRTISTDFPSGNYSNSNSKQNSGGFDAFITQFSSTGEMIKSGYYGGADFDEVQGIKIDEDYNIYLTGITQSNDLPISNDAFQRQVQGKEDIFLTKLNDDLEPLWGTYIGGIDTESISSLDFRDDMITIVGHTKSLNFPTYNSSPYSFGGEDSVIARFSKEGEPLWISRISIILDPHLDYDDDELTNLEEVLLSSNPLDPDTDNDGMEDGWETQNKLDPNKSDATLDADHDGVENGFENSLNSNPNNPDSDGDGMNDGWEYQYQLRINKNDTLDDPDNDSLPNIWEYQMLLNPKDPSDAFDDPDEDGLTNLEEFKRGLDATNPDTDGDTMKDGWEVDHELNPLDKSDASKDADGDLLPNDFEYRYNLNPQNPSEIYVIFLFIIGVITGMTYLFLRYRKINKRAIDDGYGNYWLYRSSLKLGFQDVETQTEALKQGFITKEMMDVVHAAGLENTEAMLDHWFEISSDVKTELQNKIDLEAIRTKIDQTTNPFTLNSVEIEVMSSLDTITRLYSQVRNSIALIETIERILSRTKNAFVHINSLQIKEHQHSLQSNLDKMIPILSGVRSAIDQRKEWFEPWEALLTLIQITEDEVPISIDEIVRIIKTDEKHAEELLVLLLKENSQIGKYHSDRKTYVKGIGIEDYIALALARLKDFDIEDS